MKPLPFFPKNFRLPGTWAVHFQQALQRFKAFVKAHPKATLVGAGVVLLAAAMVVIGIVFLFLLHAGRFGKLPTTAELKRISQPIASEIYSADSVLLGRFYVQNRLPVRLNEVPKHLQAALIATEDARFYKHKGVDLRAWCRVAVRTILMQNESSGGGSTLSQQLAKNLYPRQQYRYFSTPVNKAREIAIAQRLERVYDKDELLELYLNTIPFSDNVYGIQMASQRFFNKSPKDLTVEQGALLIGTLKATTAYHPVKNPDRSQQRRNVVLSRMVKTGYLPQSQFDSLKALPLALNYSNKTNGEGIGEYFREHLRLELEEKLENMTKPDGSLFNLYADGLKIYTTLDSRLQRHAEQAVRQEMARIQDAYFKHFRHFKNAHSYGSDVSLRQAMLSSERYQTLREKGLTPAQIDSAFAKPVKMSVFSWKAGGKEKEVEISPLDSLKYNLSLLSTGLLAVAPQSGAVKAWVGGIDFRHFKFDHVKSRRQVGSTFKPIVFAKALQQGISPCRSFQNEFKVYEEFDDWAPRNVRDEYGGSFNMSKALQESVNTVAVQVILETGVDPVRQLAQQMGVSSPMPPEAGIALGAVDLSLYEMVNVYATLANQGVKPELHCITHIETVRGERLADFKAPDPGKFSRALAKEDVQILTHILQKVVENGTASRLRNLAKFQAPVAGKTGTSNDNRDGWFLGYTPDLVVGAWVGGDNQWVRFHDTNLGQGSSTALPICANFLNGVYADKHFKAWNKRRFPKMNQQTLARVNCPEEQKKTFLQKLLTLPGNLF